MKTLLLVPAYNEGTALAALVAELLALAPRVVDGLVLIDDGSTDGCVDNVPDQPRLLRIRHAHNEGKARALIAGMQHALADGADLIVTMDADGQHRPADLPRMLHAAQNHRSDIIIGARLADRGSIPTARYRANRFANFWIAWASGHPVVDSQSGFRVYPADIVRAVLPALERRYPPGPGARRKGFVFESEFLIAAGQRGHATTAVRIPALYGDTKRASHFRPVADITQIVLMVAGHLLRRGLYLQGLWRSLRYGGVTEEAEVAKSAEG